MSRFGAHYQISRPTGVCAASGDPLEPGTTCIATLCEREDDEGFDRVDYSLSAWEAGKRPERLFSFWKSTVTSPDTKRKLLVDDEVLMDLMTRLAEDKRPQRQAFRFVLTLILMRKRLLKFVGRVGGVDGMAERWQMRPKGVSSDERPLEVVNPMLSDEDVKELTAQLSEILQGEL